MTVTRKIRAGAIGLRPRAWLLLVVATALGLIAFFWPMLLGSGSGVTVAHSSDAPWIFILLLPLLFAVIMAELADGSLDSKAVALLGVLAACGAALRLPSGGAAGFEPVFFLLIPAGRVFGRGFGFVLGALTLFSSALITGGVGPWLPFQMFGAAWIGFGAGCLPAARGTAERWMLAGYGAASALAYGMLLNMWFWPFGVGGDTRISYVPGDPVVDNLSRFWSFHIATSFGFDIPRAFFTALFLLIAGRPVLAALRRAARRAAFDAPVEFEPPRSRDRLQGAPATMEP